jgi:beta-N-acetylhexosaminidase
MGALAGMANDLAGAALSAGCDVLLHCTGKLEDAAALLPGCPALSDDALRRLAFADAARRGFGAGDMAALRGLRDAGLAGPVLAVGEGDPTERA